MTSIVSIDIETTGLDPQKDAIIEIGAVRFNAQRIEDEWSTLINPGRHIPEQITALTGIDDTMVRNAPRIQDVLEELDNFVGDLPVLGQNVRFDLGFLQKQRILALNPVLDTYELASVLLPTASRYNLGALGQLLGIPLPANHRALDDARVTHAVYERLLALAVELPLELLAEIVRLGEPLDWDGNFAFLEALRIRAREQAKGKRVAPSEDDGPLFEEEEKGRKGPPPGLVKTPIELDPEEVASILEYGGPFSRYFEAYEQRPEQVSMLKAVTKALSYGNHLMVEAGTGVGKCLTGNTWITFEDGQRRQIGEIVRDDAPPAEPILCIDQKGKLAYQKIQAVHRNGIRPVWELRTGLGHKITATSNHPFLTFDGWRSLGELKIGDRIAAVRRLPTGNLSYPTHETFVAGAMLGDGGCGYPDSLTFTNFDPEVVETFRQNVEKLGNVQMTAHKAKGHYGFRRLSLMGHERSGLNLLLEKLDVLGRGARAKNIPAAYFLADQKSIAHLLAGLWVTDGCIEQPTGNISISSASEQLISDIQHLLLRLGIISRVRYKSSLLGEKRFDAWNLSILEIQSKRLFWQTVGKYMVGKRKQRLDAWHEAHQDRKYNPNDDLFPVEAWDHIDRARNEAGKSWYAIRNASIIASDRKREISRDKMVAIGEFLSSPALMETATSDLYWDRIVAIEPVGEADTFDLTMDGEPNFIANDLVVHNSFAYLVPAAIFAVENNTRVVVSTNTINLQDQLIQKDIPDLRAALGLDFRAAVLKGRANYLCPRRLEVMRHHGPNNPDEMRVLAKVLVWRMLSASGDRNELNLNRPQEKDVWMKVSAEDEACSGETCAARMGGVCPFYRAKQAAQNAHILIVNHALLLSDVASGSKVLPDYQYLIVDEAHHLESATTGALSFRMSQQDFERMLREVGGTNSGVLGRLLTETRDVLRPSDYASFTQLVHRASDMAFRLDSHAKDFFFSLAEFVALQREGRPQGLYAYQERIQPHTRTAQGWDNVELCWNTAGDTMRLLVNVVGEIYKGVAELYSDGVEELEDPLGSLGNLYRRLSEAELSISGMIHEPTNELVYWIEVQPQNKRLTLNHAPLRVGPLIQKYLWHEKDCVVLTSATLTAAGDFTYLRNVLMAEEADELTLGSPFDYESSTLLFVANDVPEPNAPGYENAINRGLIQLCRATGGRTLVLFTSYAQLKRTSGAISGPLANDEIEVFEQGEGASPQALLEAFKSTERAVLLGTRSFWEGVDVPGDMLSVVVITKLPFEVPSDPLIAARSETFEDPFGEYQIPEAILKFRQGFGRLIRSASDRGVVAIFDRRVMTKMYGKLFIASLPQCTLRQGTLNDLPRMAEKWLG
jgi:DNA polymerase-3 subunit epsilon/ATP-dependent DNA helicase DinG